MKAHHQEQIKERLEWVQWWVLENKGWEIRPLCDTEGRFYLYKKIHQEIVPVNINSGIMVVGDRCCTKKSLFEVLDEVVLDKVSYHTRIV